MKFPKNLEKQIIGFLNEGKYIHAIKLYREKTGRTLSESKRAVDEINSRQPARPDNFIRESWNRTHLIQQCIELLENKEYISAIRLYRNVTGEGLKSSKLAIDTLVKQRKIDIYSTQTNACPANVKTKTKKNKIRLRNRPKPKKKNKK